jgi:Cysteine-rich secretory protein family
VKLRSKSIAFSVAALMGILTASVFAAAVADPKQDRGAAREMFSLLNQARERHGLARLEWSDRLERAALAHAKLVAEHEALSHDFPGEPALTVRLAKTDLRFDFSGENLALNSNPEAAHEALMHSPPHRKNILDTDYNAVGIAAIKSGGSLYVVEDFAHELPDISASEFADRLTAEFEKLRREADVPKLKRVEGRSLHKRACEMARSDTVDVSVNVPGARYVLTFTATEPQKLPPELKRLRLDRHLASYAIGACFERTHSYPNGVYWLVMGLFPKRRGD